VRAIYHPETDTIEVPMGLMKRLDQRAARLEVWGLILEMLVTEMRLEELRRRLLWLFTLQKGGYRA
jgi:hypothetical protein